MDDIFAALGHPARLWIVIYVASHGPTRQKDLATAIAASGLVPTSVNDGATSHLVRPLIASGLLIRDRPRGPLRLRYGDQTVRILTAASAIAVAIAADSSESAGRQHADLLRGLTKLVEQLGDAEAGGKAPERPRGEDS
ncbi:MAG: hypothetical protein ABSG64_02910 [Solirubrobacteraceae bacterium]|jgi:hypothetical protein